MVLHIFISDHHTFSEFGCDMTKSGDTTLVRMPSAKLPGGFTGNSSVAGPTGENSRKQDHTNSNSHFIIAAVVTDKLLGRVCSAALASGIWETAIKRNGEKNLGVTTRSQWRKQLIQTACRRSF